jgi:hypothetical protein
MRYIKSLLLGVGVVMITALGCDVIQSNKNVPSNIEESGETLLPKIQKDKFILNFFGDDEPKKKTGNASVSWDEIESVIEIAQEQTGEELIAVFSVRDSTGAWYNYYLQPLGFSPEAMEEAQGETQLFVYELDPDTLGSVSRIAVANIPSGTISMIEFEQWILPMTNLKNKSNSTFVTEDCGWEIDVPGGSACWEGGCSYYDPEYGYYCNDNNGNDYDPTWNWPKSGGGGGSSGGSESGSDEDDCRPPVCIPDEENEMLLFMGDIIIDESVLSDQKVQCTLNKLLNNGNTLAETILKFSDESVELDLKIELTEVEADDPGSLVSSPSSNIFSLQIDKSRAQERLPIQLAGTIMHEAIHAEMRRFLYSNPGASTLSGFPSTFAEDWRMYINAQNGKDFEEQLSNAEHNAMADRYIDVIISGLQDFDRNQLSYDQYYALALEGLWESDLYQNINSNYNSWSEYNSAKNLAIDASDQNCTY